MIWFLRHGEAEDEAADDAGRRLTAKGRRQAELAGRTLAALGATIETCLTSPKVRARDTAEIAARELGIEAEQTDALRGGEFDADELASGRGETLLTGHEPDLSRTIERMTGARVKLKKGGIAAVDGSTLVTLLRPAQIAAIGSRPER